MSKIRLFDFDLLYTHTFSVNLYKVDVILYLKRTQM